MGQGEEKVDQMVKNWNSVDHGKEFGCYSRLEAHLTKPTHWS